MHAICCLSILGRSGTADGMDTRARANYYISPTCVTNNWAILGNNNNVAISTWSGVRSLLIASRLFFVCWFCKCNAESMTWISNRRASYFVGYFYLLSIFLSGWARRGTTDDDDEFSQLPCLVKREYTFFYTCVCVYVGVFVFRGICGFASRMIRERWTRRNDWRETAVWRNGFINTNVELYGQSST